MRDAGSGCEQAGLRRTCRRASRACKCACQVPKPAKRGKRRRTGLVVSSSNKPEGAASALLQCRDQAARRRRRWLPAGGASMPPQPPMPRPSPRACIRGGAIVEQLRSQGRLAAVGTDHHARLHWLVVSLEAQRDPTAALFKGVECNLLVQHARWQLPRKRSLWDKQMQQCRRFGGGAGTSAATPQCVATRPALSVPAAAAAASQGPPCHGPPTHPPIHQSCPMQLSPSLPSPTCNACQAHTEAGPPCSFMKARGGFPWRWASRAPSWK